MDSRSAVIDDLFALAPHHFYCLVLLLQTVQKLVDLLTVCLGGNQLRGFIRILSKLTQALQDLL